MYDFTGKNVCYVADCGGIALETCKVLMTKNIAVSTNTINSFKNLRKRARARDKKKTFIFSMQIYYCDSSDSK